MLIIKFKILNECTLESADTKSKIETLASGIWIWTSFQTLKIKFKRGRGRQEQNHSQSFSENSVRHVPAKMFIDDNNKPSFLLKNREKSEQQTSSTLAWVSSLCFLGFKFFLQKTKFSSKIGKFEMENLADKSKPKYGFESFDASDSVSEYRDSSTSSSRSSSETLLDHATAKECSSPVPLGWPIRKAQLSKCYIYGVSGDEIKTTYLGDSNLKKQNTGSKVSGKWWCFEFWTSVLLPRNKIWFFFELCGVLMFYDPVHC